jgi:hypothetical protein
VKKFATTTVIACFFAAASCASKSTQNHPASGGSVKGLTQGVSAVLDDGGWEVDPPSGDVGSAISRAKAIASANRAYLEGHKYQEVATLVTLTLQEKIVETGQLTYDHRLTWIVNVQEVPVCPGGGGLPTKPTPLRSSATSCEPGNAFIAIDALTGDFVTGFETNSPGGL